MKNAAVLKVIETVYVYEKYYGVHWKRAKTDDGKSAEEAANSVRSVHSSYALELATVTTSAHVCLRNENATAKLVFTSAQLYRVL